MRIVRKEEIFISIKENETWIRMQNLLEGVKREATNPQILEKVDRIQEDLFDLADYIEIEEE